MGRPREHDEETRSQLLLAAERLLAEGGPESISVRLVADAVGTSTRAVYSVFGGKDGLMDALYAHGFEELGALLRAIPETRDPVADFVRCGIDVFRRFSVAHPNLFRLTFERLVPDLEPSREARAAARATLTELAKKAERCRGSGLFAERDPHSVALQFHALCQGLASVELHGWIPPPRKPVEFWREALSTFIEGGRSPARRRRAKKKRR